ncbi:HK97 family phage prohead protease [Staphylococcus borealis]|uniref:HK97 family phage prohead protease n=1 Tax=Staphylococcus borealis TaxID=2742203 RepID=UPI0039E8D5D0
MTNSNVGAAQDMVIEGYALLFNVLSDDVGGYKEVVLPSALDNVDIEDVKCLINHDDRYVIGRTKARTLELSVDSKGLKFKCFLPNTTYARDIYENINVGNVNQCSYHALFPKSMNGVDTGFSWSVQNGEYIRTIEQLDKLNDVSVVTVPAYKDTNVLAVQRDAGLQQFKEIEKINIALDLESLRLKT